MDPQQRRQVLQVVGIIAALIVLITVVGGGYLFEWKWTGLVKDEDFSKRTLWDWLKLLIIPTVIAGGTILFNRWQRARELEIEARRGWDDALKAYLDDIANLMTEHHLRSLSPGEDIKDVRAVARARTLTVLPRLDGSRKRSVIQFLYEAALITRVGAEESIVSIHGADLSGADLRGISLGNTILQQTNLRGANLAHAWLKGTNLRRTDLRGANLIDAVLHSADLRDARLDGAIFSSADLRRANLSRARLAGADFRSWPAGAFPSSVREMKRLADQNWTDLLGREEPPDRTMGSYGILRSKKRGGTDLRGANLSNTTGINNEELSKQTWNLEGATMPDGQKYEEWLKSKGRGEDGENSGSL